MTRLTGRNSSPTRITQPHSVARDSSTRESRSKMALCRYNGLCRVADYAGVE
jgi:hypothetical protein